MTMNPPRIYVSSIGISIIIRYWMDDHKPYTARVFPKTDSWKLVQRFIKYRYSYRESVKLICFLNEFSQQTGAPLVLQ